MKRRTLKKKVKNLDALSTVIDNAHDVAVMKQVLWTFWSIIGEKDFKAELRADPFKDEHLNTMLAFIWDEIKEKRKVVV